MAETDPPSPLRPDECREPTLEDLVKLCRALNQAGASYLVVGGFAIRAAGFLRNTMDVEILVSTDLENERRVIQALLVLPDQAIRELEPGEIAQFGVVRVADEFVVDLMKSGCGVDYADAVRDAVHAEIDGVRIPFASPQTLWRMKQTGREKDIPDRMFLRRLLKEQGIDVGPEPPVRKAGGLRQWLRRWFGAGA